MRQEHRQQTVQQLDFIFDLDCPIADGFPRVIIPSQGNLRFSGELEMKFWAIKNGETTRIVQCPHVNDE